VSLAITPSTVSGVLLASGWVSVWPKSFDLDSYEFVDGGVVLHGGGQSGISATGFRFKDSEGTVHYGPLSSILAVTTDE
jgi:hypothetical protein